MKIKSSKLFKILVFILCFLMVFEQSGFAQIAGELDISGSIAAFRNNIIQDKFRPLHLRYLQYDQKLNNFRLLIDKGDVSKDNGRGGFNLPYPKLSKSFIEESTKTLLQYFLVGVTLPNDSFWVNLRPDSPDNVIDPLLGQTEVGKILLEADVQLKKDTARFTSPETPEGKEYWDKLYVKAGEIFGSQNVTIPTLTRPWIVPDEIILRETTDNAYIYKATLKVMLEDDYLKGSAVYNFNDPRLKELNTYASSVLREKIIPKLTQEINASKKYASLRQVYYSLILSQWFKQRFQGKSGDGSRREPSPSFYASLINSKNLNGLLSRGNWSKNTYFQQYQKSFKDGEYNFKVPMTTPYGQVIRSYFSGGIDVMNTRFAIKAGLALDALKQLPSSIANSARFLWASVRSDGAVKMDDSQLRIATGPLEDSFDGVANGVKEHMGFVDVGNVLPGENISIAEDISNNRAIENFLFPYLNSHEATPIDIIKIAQNFSRAITSVVALPKVYYIGLGHSSEYGSRLNVLLPLLQTDFAELIEVEKMFVSFEDFQRILSEQLGNIVDKGTDITFSKDSTRSSTYKAGFMYKGKLRTVIAYFEFDGTRQYPSELAGGYNVLLNAVAIRDIEFYQRLISLLADDAGFIIGDGRDVTTADPKQYKDAGSDLNAIFLGYFLKHFRFLLGNFSEVSSRPFFRLGKRTYWDDTQQRNGFPQSRLVLLAKNKTVERLLDVSNMSEHQQLLASTPPAAAPSIRKPSVGSTEGSINDAIRTAFGTIESAENKGASAAKSARREAVQLIINAFRAAAKDYGTDDFDGHWDNLFKNVGTAIDILDSIQDQDPLRQAILKILQTYQNDISSLQNAIIDLFKNETRTTQPSTPPAAAQVKVVDNHLNGVFNGSDGRIMQEPPEGVDIGQGPKNYINHGEKVSYLLTTNILSNELPYSTCLREPAETGELPQGLPESSTVSIDLPDRAIILLSQGYNGSGGLVKLGFLNNRPVALKTYWAGRENEGTRNDEILLKDYRGAVLADHLGIGPAVHGIFIDSDGKYNIVMDVVPGDVSEVNRHKITLQTFEDLAEILKRLENLDPGRIYFDDLQYYITPEGRIQIIDQGSLGAPRQTDRQEIESEKKEKFDILFSLAPAEIQNQVEDIYRSGQPHAVAQEEGDRRNILYEEALSLLRAAEFSAELNKISFRRSLDQLKGAIIENGGIKYWQKWNLERIETYGLEEYIEAMKNSSGNIAICAINASEDQVQEMLMDGYKASHTNTRSVHFSVNKPYWDGNWGDSGVAFVTSLEALLENKAFMSTTSLYYGDGEQFTITEEQDLAVQNHSLMRWKEGFYFDRLGIIFIPEAKMQGYEDFFKRIGKRPKRVYYYKGTLAKAIDDFKKSNNLKADKPIVSGEIRLGHIEDFTKGPYFIVISPHSIQPFTTEMPSAAAQPVIWEVSDFDRDLLSGKHLSSTIKEAMQPYIEKIKKILNDEEFIKETLKNIHGINNFSMSDVESIHAQRIDMGTKSQVILVSIICKGKPSIEFLIKIAYEEGRGKVFKDSVKNLRTLNNDVPNLVPRLGAVNEALELWSEEYKNTTGGDLIKWRWHLAKGDSKTLRAVEEAVIRAYYLFYQKTKGGIRDPGPKNFVIVENKNETGEFLVNLIDTGLYYGIPDSSFVKEWIILLRNAGGFKAEDIFRIMAETEQGRNHLKRLFQYFEEDTELLSAFKKACPDLFKEISKNDNGGAPSVAAEAFVSEAIDFWSKWNADESKKLDDLKQEAEIGSENFIAEGNYSSLLWQAKTFWAEQLPNEVREKAIRVIDHLTENIDQHGGGEGVIFLRYDKDMQKVYIAVVDKGSGWFMDSEGRPIIMVSEDTRGKRFIQRPGGREEDRDGIALGQVLENVEEMHIYSQGDHWSSSAPEKKRRNSAIEGLRGTLVFVAMSTKEKTPSVKPIATQEDETRSFAPPEAELRMTEKEGGIDFRGLPIVTQPMIKNLETRGRFSVENRPLYSNLDKEWQDVENMLNAGIIPSLERIREYLILSCKSPDCQEKINQVLSGIADIFRLEEEHSFKTEAQLKEILVLLELNKSAEQLSAELSKIKIMPQEPKKI